MPWRQKFRLPLRFYQYLRHTGVKNNVIANNQVSHGLISYSLRRVFFFFHRTARALTDTPTPRHCCNDSWHYAKCHVHPKLSTWCSFTNAKSTKPSRVHFYSCMLSSTELYLLEYERYVYKSNLNHQKCHQYHYDYYFRLYARLMNSTPSPPPPQKRGIHLFKFAWETSVSALLHIFSVSNVQYSVSPELIRPSTGAVLASCGSVQVVHRGRWRCWGSCVTFLWFLDRGTTLA